MHRALSEHAAEDPDFRPEPIERADLAHWREELADRAGDMLTHLDRARPRLSEEARGLAERLLALQASLLDKIRTLIPDEVVADKTRYHADYHLGQVLVVQNDVFIIDFEGEPARPLAERRQKSSPLRDVAGMIRSFDYAAVAAVRQLAATRPAAEARMSQLAEGWRHRAVDGFRAAYRKTMRGCGSYPASKRQAREMIHFFTLEKAVYEVTYELASRPNWVAIPLRGILGVLEQAGGNDHAASS
jgi:maltose alpha-D-glucosyltransferase/alpha-amylase